MTHKFTPKPKVTFREVWKEGDIFTKLSFFFMGLAQLKNKQWLKGIIFLLTEIVFVAWLVINGINTIYLLGSLGEVKKGGLHFDASQGVYERTAADNSMLILLFGILALIVVVVVAYLYYVNLKSVRHLYILNKEDKHIPTTMEDLASLLNERFHTTLMFIPLAGVLLFTILPILYMVSLAFTNYDNSHQWPAFGFSWVGLENFGNILTGQASGTFFPVLAWTLVWAVAATATTFFFGVLLAMLIESKGIKFKAFWRTVFVTVFAVPQFVSLLMMHQFLDKSGPLNTFFQNIGWTKTFFPFLTDPTWARVTVIVVNMWIGIPVSMLVATAIIQNLPQDQIEAAKIDGANAFQVFRSITFPQILFVMSPALIQQFIGNINNFNVIYLLTGGAPANSNYFMAGSTDLLVTWLYNLTMGQLKNYNLAAVVGIMTFIISAAFSLIAYRKTNAFKEG
ncbi:MAG: carbohydrate ABC transporter permease [Lactococcus sp.]